jgi:benzoylformate decarboxylase
MASVREVTVDLLRAHGMTTVFGNPGSTELTMLTEFPDDFRYVLGLQELVVVGMADGFAQATGQVTHVNLHTAPGVGNAVGGIFNAYVNKAPLLITAGQQVRAQMLMEASLTHRDAVVTPQPWVKWSYEPPRAQDVPGAIARAIVHASLPPRGPAFVSIPMDDWGAEADPDASAQLLRRRFTGRARPNDPVLERLAEKLRTARAPALVAGPEIDAGGGWDAAVRLAERQRLAVWATSAVGGSRLGFPEDHPQFQGILPPAIGPAGEALRPYDLVVVAGSSIFPYYPYIPGPLLGDETELVAITSDPDEAARAPIGAAIVADVCTTLNLLATLAGDAPPDREVPAPRPEPPPILDSNPAAGPISGAAAVSALASVWPQDGVLVVETPSSTFALRQRLRLGRPGSYYQGGGGGLGFGIAAAVGVQMAERSRPVVAVLGEGSAQYGITALWTAAAYRVPVTFLVLNNSEYAILKWFGMLEGVSGVPGMDLPALDVAGVAAAYGVPSQRVSGVEELSEALRGAIPADDGPRLVEVAVAPGMSLE